MGILMPAGTPPERAARISAEFRRVLALPEIAKRLEDANLEPMSNSPAEFWAVLSKDLQTWKQMIELGGVKAN